MLNRKGGTSVGELAFIMAMFLPTILMAALRSWALFVPFLIFDLSFGIAEIVSVKQTGKTISQRFGEYQDENPGKGNIILFSMALMWASLLIHLKMMKKK